MAHATDDAKSCRIAEANICFDGLRAPALTHTNRAINKDSDREYQMKVRAAVLDRMGAPPPYAASKPLTITEVSIDPPGYGEVLVKIAAAGLCHSDLSVIEGNRPRPLPMLLGHEAAAIVEELGEGVHDLAVGDHVVLVFVPSCGHCGPCAEGRPALCEPGAVANNAGTLLSGERRIHCDGGPINHHMGCSAFAEYATVSRCSLIKVDRDLPLDEAALFGCAVLTGVGAVINTARVQTGSSVAVIGLGGVGLAALLGAVAAGARSVIAVDLADASWSYTSAWATKRSCRCRQRREAIGCHQWGRRICFRDGRIRSSNGSRVQDNTAWRHDGNGRTAAADAHVQHPTGEPGR